MKFIRTNKASSIKCLKNAPGALANKDVRRDPHMISAHPGLSRFLKDLHGAYFFQWYKLRRQKVWRCIILGRKNIDLPCRGLKCKVLNAGRAKYINRGEVKK